MAERPGIMFYFDMAEPLKGLSYEEKGRLLEAVLDYGQYGVVPEFEGVLSIVWGFVRPKLDADAKRYRKTVVKNTYSSYCAKEKKAGRTPIDLNEWLEQEGIDTEWNRTVPFGSVRYPTTAATPKVESTSTTESNAIQTATIETEGAGDGEGAGEEEPAKDFETLRFERMAQLANYRG